MFVDMYEYLDSDPDIGRGDFISSVLSAGEVGGELYYLFESIRLNTLVGKTENIGNAAGWGLAEYLDMAENLADGVYMICNEKRQYTYEKVIKPALVEFVDYESATCTFDSELFIRVLNYLKSLPYTPVEFYSSERVSKELTDEIAMTEPITINEFTMYALPRALFGTEEISFIGYPNRGNIIEASKGYAISAQSGKEIRDGAWQFIKHVILNQDVTSISGFPVMYDVYRGYAENSQKGYYLLGPGYTMASSNTEFAQEEADSRRTIKAQMTQKDTDDLLALIEAVEPSRALDAAIAKIIEEETANFYGGAKTAAETAAIIQNRASIYLSERK